MCAQNINGGCFYHEYLSEVSAYMDGAQSLPFKYKTLVN